MVDAHADTLRGLRAIYIDAGKRDQYYLDLGAEGVPATRWSGSASPTSSSSCSTATHSSIEYRYPIALRYLAERLT